MLGAIIGDIVGSRFEFHNIKTKDFEFFAPECRITDDSVMTLAIAKAILEANGNYDMLGGLAEKHMRQLGRLYCHGDYGIRFRKWLHYDDMGPYNSFGNGAAMRVSPCGFAAKSLEEAKLQSRKVTEVTHNHQEGIKGAEATAVCVFMARDGKSKNEIRNHINEHYYKMDFTLDEIRDSYQHDESCQNTVPQAIAAFIESRTFEDAVRNAVSIGGDSDTLAAIAGSIAEAAYGVSRKMRKLAMTYIDERLTGTLTDFENVYPSHINEES